MKELNIAGDTVGNVLVIEDGAGDSRLMEEALREVQFCRNATLIEDGFEAMDFLHRRPPFEDAKRPDLIFLDLHLPIKNGLEVLEQLKQDSDLRRIPIVVLTSSKAQSDVVTAYDHHANCYIVKPVSYANLVEIAQSMKYFWFSIVTLPSA